MALEKIAERVWVSSGGAMTQGHARLRADMRYASVFRAHLNRWRKC